MRLWLTSALAAMTAGSMVLFPVGSRVTVINGCANIRSTSQGNSTVLGQQCTGTLGTVTASEVRSTASDTFSRANINFDTGVDGWTWVYYLKLVAPPPVGDTLKVVLQPSTLDFGPQVVGTATASKPVVLTNQGTDTLRFPGGSTMLDTINFRYTGDDCAPKVAPGLSCTFFYLFQPKSAGTFSGDNKIATNRGTVRVILTGVGTVVTPPPPSGGVASIKVSPLGFSALVGAEVTVSAIALDSAGNTLANAMTWSSSDSTIASVRLPYAPSVTQAANVYLAKAGTATITASASGKSANIAITAMFVDTLPVSFMASGLKFNPIPILSGHLSFSIIDTNGLVISHASCTIAKP